MHARKGLNSAFCLGRDKHEDCLKVKNVSEGKQIDLRVVDVSNVTREGRRNKVMTLLTIITS